MRLIHVQWSGPYPIDSLSQPPGELDPIDREHDKGVYQIYGDHPVYGMDTLLYIGKTQEQTLLDRISQHGWDLEERTISCYVGRLAGTSTPPVSEWSQQIIDTEKLLIQAHKPAHNSREILHPLPTSFAEILVLNWGNRRALLPEVSGAFWSDKFHRLQGYKTCGEH